MIFLILGFFKIYCFERIFRGLGGGLLYLGVCVDFMVVIEGGVRL